MVKFKITLEKELKLPLIDLGKPAYSEIAKELEEGVLKNIVLQKQANGSPLKSNKPSYREFKRAAGWTLGNKVRALIAQKRRFIQTNQKSWRHLVTKNTAGLNAANPELRQLSSWVQQKGFTGWFGASKMTMEKIRIVIRKHLKLWMKKAKEQNSK